MMSTYGERIVKASLAERFTLSREVSLYDCEENVYTDDGKSIVASKGDTCVVLDFVRVWVLDGYETFARVLHDRTGGIFLCCNADLWYYVESENGA